MIRTGIRSALYAALIVSISSVLFAQSIILPQANKPSNMGMEFYVSFPSIDCGGNAPHCMLYISSPVDTRVLIDANSGAFQDELVVKAFQLMSYELPGNAAMLYKGDWLTPAPPDQVYEGRGIHLKADFPVTVNAVLKANYTSESFLVLPVESLGNEYIVAACEDESWLFGTANTTENRPPQVLIVATEDNTNVTLTIGGNLNTKTMNGLITGQSSTFYMNKGDVYSVATMRKPWDGDLSGTKITSGKRVAVICGHLAAFIPTNYVSQVDYLAEMQLPTSCWGKDYLIPRDVPARYSYPMKCCAAKDNTQIYFNGSFRRVLATGGGAEGKGYFQQRANYDTSNAVCRYSSTKPIGITVFGTSYTDGNAYDTDPFQMTIVPTEQFTTSYLISPSSSKSGIKFSINKIGLVFRLTNDGVIPPDLEIGNVVNGQMQWQKVTTMFGPSVSSLDFFSVGSDNISYAYKECVLKSIDVVGLRANTPFGCYSYGGSYAEGYGSPGGMLALDLSKEADNIAPSVVFTTQSSTVSGTITDAPADAALRSNLSKVFLNYGSANVRLVNDAITNAGVYQCAFRIEQIDTTRSALAYLTVSDRRGNDTTITVTFDAIITTPVPRISILGASEICAGDSAVLRCDGEYKSYLWSNGDTTRQAIIHNLPAGRHEFTVVVQSTDEKSITSAPASIRVNALPPIPVLQQEGDSVSTAHSLNTNYAWYHNGSPMNENDDSFIIISQSGRYRLVVSDAITGCSRENYIDAVHQSSPVGNDAIEAITIFPNPVSDLLSIRVNQASEVELELLNSMGIVQTVETHLSDDAMVLNVHSLSPGMYLLRIKRGATCSYYKLIRD